MKSQACWEAEACKQKEGYEARKEDVGPKRKKLKRERSKEKRMRTEED